MKAESKENKNSLLAICRSSEAAGGARSNCYEFFGSFCRYKNNEEKLLSPAANDNPELFQHYFNANHLGSGSLITNKVGATYQTLAYAPHGELLVNAIKGNYDEPYKFTGYERDQESGLDYAHARYREPEKTIFYSTDPMWFKYPYITPYNYCGNNPIRYIDKDGREKHNGLGKGGVAGTASDNDMIHIYAHGNAYGMTYRDKDGNKTYIADAFDLVDFLNENSYIWQTRQPDETIYIVLHSCNAANIEGHESRVKDMSRQFANSEDVIGLGGLNIQNVVLIAPDKNLILNSYGREYIMAYNHETKLTCGNFGNWICYKNGFEIGRILGIPSNSWDLVNYSRNYVRPPLLPKSNDQTQLNNTWSIFRKSWVDDFFEKIYERASDPLINSLINK